MKLTCGWYFESVRISKFSLFYKIVTTKRTKGKKLNLRFNYIGLKDLCLE